MLHAHNALTALTMAPHAETADHVECMAVYQQPEVVAPTVRKTATLDPPNDYDYTYDHRDGYMPEQHDPAVPYKVAEHILWAPRKIRVASIGAGASGIMLCYKKEKEFGDDIDLVVYDREFPLPALPKPTKLTTLYQVTVSAAVFGMQTGTLAVVVMYHPLRTSSRLRPLRNGHGTILRPKISRNTTTGLPGTKATLTTTSN
jgi:hypothetical protein